MIRIIEQWNIYLQLKKSNHMNSAQILYDYYFKFSFMIDKTFFDNLSTNCLL